jgi:hypothetical protein
MPLSTTRRAAALAAATTVLALAPCARAQTTPPSCSSLPGTIIYGAGGSAQQPLLKEIATQELSKKGRPMEMDVAARSS